MTREVHIHKGITVLTLSGLSNLAKLNMPYFLKTEIGHRLLYIIKEGLCIPDPDLAYMHLQA